MVINKNMDIIATRYITRETAEDMWVAKMLETLRPKYEKRARRMDDEVLGENIGDETCDWIIVEEWRIDKREERLMAEIEKEAKEEEGQLDKVIRKAERLRKN